MKKKLLLVVPVGILIILVGGIGYIFVHRSAQDSVSLKQPSVVSEDETENMKQCEKYTDTDRVVQYLKTSGVKVPVMLPTSLPRDFVTASWSPTGGSLYLDSSVSDDGGYSIVLSFDYGGDTDCSWSQANHGGRFVAYPIKPGEINRVLKGSEEVSLSNGITGYLYETGRSDVTVEWRHEGTFYMIADLPLSSEEAIEMANSAIANVK
ncbi:MAG: DUF4367 domain-containing protein [Candidatus Pacebacteria bacterium]|nr:DUF4367 domain-containing protein [Candidatus Paceibacterota bacterium]